jgi:hypothetical protein
VVPDLSNRAESVNHRSSEDRAEDRKTYTDRAREPDRLHTFVCGPIVRTGADQTRDATRRPICQEDEQAVTGDQQGGRYGKATELRRTKMTYHRGVGKEVQGFGDECDECGQS